MGVAPGAAARSAHHRWGSNKPTAHEQQAQPQQVPAVRRTAPDSNGTPDALAGHLKQVPQVALRHQEHDRADGRPAWCPCRRSPSISSNVDHDFKAQRGVRSVVATRVYIAPARVANSADNTLDVVRYTPPVADGFGAELGSHGWPAARGRTASSRCAAAPAATQRRANKSKVSSRPSTLAPRKFLHQLENSRWHQQRGHLELRGRPRQPPVLTAGRPASGTRPPASVIIGEEDRPHIAAKTASGSIGTTPPATPPGPPPALPQRQARGQWRCP